MAGWNDDEELDDDKQEVETSFLQTTLAVIGVLLAVTAIILSLPE